jgi:tetratricopeptide (TPR) repeat protein
MLPESVIKQIKDHLAEGDQFLDRDDYTRASHAYHRALALIPEAKTDHPVALDVFLAVGEALFFSARYSDSIRSFQMAMKCPGGVEDSLVHLRLGEAYYELGDLDSAADELARAYILHREDIFEDEDPKYLSFLKTRIDTRKPQ